MKAAMFYGKEDVRVEEIEEPRVRPGTVKIAPAFNGICGSDLHHYHEGPIPPAPTADSPHPISGETLPVVLGHDIELVRSGKVVLAPLVTSRIWCRCTDGGARHVIWPPVVRRAGALQSISDRKRSSAC